MFSTRLLNKLTIRICTENKIRYINQPINKIYQVKKSTSILGFYIPLRMSHSESSEQPQTHQNRLAQEKSPYLLQHATNPVNWYPWGPEAFEKARKENKLIFLSVGYSTCHWCHVMEKESFENASVAEIMNRYFVNVKVDREERPDIDKVYMSFIHASSGSGGWPMSVFLTPNLEPITGGTYFPPEDQWGRPGFKTVLRKIAEQWGNDQGAILESGKKILGVLKKVNGTLSSSKTVDFPLESCFEKCINQFGKSFDDNFGGFSRQPKFPQPSNLNFLFHFYVRNKETSEGQNALDMALKTLKCMANGGINDHISLGFARYSTDQKWHVPHFEKMLYDQAQLTYSFCDAYLTTKDAFYSKIINDILTYVSRDMSHETGGFYSAEDADSYPTSESRHKKEGAFCVWEYSEIQTLLSDLKINDTPYSDIFSYHFNVLPNGNVPPQNDPHQELKNKNVLIVFGSIEKTAEHFSLRTDEVIEVLEKCRKILFDVRLKRPRPHLDTKILTAWNGLMISGYARAGFVLNKKEYIERGVKAAKFIKEYLWNEDEKILHRCIYKGEDGQIVQNPVPIEGFLDDYAFLIRGLLDLYEATHDITWLDWAEVLQDQQDNKFWDDQDLAYFNSSEGDSSVLIRVKDDQDGAEPCGNSISVGNLIRLAGYLDRPDLKTKAEGIFAAYSERLQKVPIALPEMTSALMLYYDTPQQIFIVGPSTNPQTEELLNAVRSRLLPGRLLVYADGTDGTASHLHSRIHVLKRLKVVDNKPTAYVCRHSACSLPVTDCDQLVKLLDGELPCSKNQ